MQVDEDKINTFNQSKDIFDVIIIGSGPAGYTAGIYT